MRKARGSAATALSVWIALVAGAPTQVQAYCPTECKRTDPKVGYCIEFGPVVPGCTETPSAPATTYGAIAYSPDSGKIGYSEKYANRAQAENRAKQECGKNDCQIAAWYYSSCGALATNDDGTWGGAQGADEQRAGKAALARCAKEGGKNCKVIASYCSR
jgi:Domain of unknown function (DUF4189)